MARIPRRELIDEDQFTNLYKSISFRKWRTREPLDDPTQVAIHADTDNTRSAIRALIACLAFVARDSAAPGAAGDVGSGSSGAEPQPR